MKMIKTLILPTIVTGFHIIADKYFHKKKNNYIIYVIIFTLMLFASYFYPAHSNELSEDEIDMYIESLIPSYGLTPEKRNMYFRACIQFGREGLIHLEKADEIILLYPRSTKRDQAHRAIEGSVASIAASNVKAKVVTVLLVMIAGYLQDVYDNWSDIEYHLKESERMFQIHDYYQDKLFRNAE